MNVMSEIDYKEFIKKIRSLNYDSDGYRLVIHNEKRIEFYAGSNSPMFRWGISEKNGYVYFIQKKSINQLVFMISVWGLTAMFMILFVGAVFIVITSKTNFFLFMVLSMLGAAFLTLMHRIYKKQYSVKAVEVLNNFMLYYSHQR